MHIREHCFETGVFRTAGINAKTNLSSAFPHMADSHLSEFYAIQRTFYAKVIFSAAEAVPHDFWQSYHTTIKKMCQNAGKTQILRNSASGVTPQ